jgi:hypothetical protein
MWTGETPLSMAASGPVAELLVKLGASATESIFYLLDAAGAYSHLLSARSIAVRCVWSRINHDLRPIRYPFAADN